MICCLSGEMPMPVSDTENAITCWARLSSSFSGSSPRDTSSTVSVTWPWCVNLKALDSRFFRICCRRLASVTIDAGRLQAAADAEVHVLGLGDVAEGALHVQLQVGQAQLADVHHHRAGLDLGQVQDVVDQHQQVVAGRVDRLGEFDLLGREVAFRVLAQLVATGSAASSAACAARATCWPGTRTCTWRSGRAAWPFLPAPAGPARLRAFLRSTSWFWCASRRAFSCSSSLVCCSSSCRRLEFLGQRLRLRQQVFRPHVGFDRVDHDADRFRQLVQEGLVGRVEAFHRGQLDHAAHLAFEDDGQHQHVERSRLRQAGGDLQASPGSWRSA